MRKNGVQAKSKIKRGAWLCGVVLVAGMFGCAGGAPVVAPMEEPAVVPVITPAPVLQETNPVAAVYSAGMEAYQNIQQAWSAEAYAQENAAHLDKVMAAERHIQRMQYFFAPVSRLHYTALAEGGTWEGLVTGPLAGVAGITVAEEGTTFSCTYWTAGRIRGELRENALYGDWQTAYTVELPIDPESEEPDPEPITQWETIRTARVWQEGDAWIIAVTWDGEDVADTRMAVTPQALYYAEGLPDVYQTDADPLAWAQWVYSGNTFYDTFGTSQETTGDAAQDSNSNEGEGT